MKGHMNSPTVRAVWPTWLLWRPARALCLLPGAPSLLAHDPCFLSTPWQHLVVSSSHTSWPCFPTRTRYWQESKFGCKLCHISGNFLLYFFFMVQWFLLMTEPKHLTLHFKACKLHQRLALSLCQDPDSHVVPMYRWSGIHFAVKL